MSGATRQTRREPGQLGMDEPPAKAGAGEPSLEWTARHWPGHSSAVGRRPPAAPSALVLWAESFPDLPRGARKLLLMLAREAEASRDRTCRASLPHVARSLAIGRNTCRRHLEVLLASGFVMMKVWTQRGSESLLGYEFRLIVDVEDRSAAEAEGFSSSRAAQGDA